MLLDLQRATLGYFERYSNPANGLVRDSSCDAASASVAGSGFAMASWVVGAERGYLMRDEAVSRTLATLRFLWNAPQSAARDATGHNGFFYHFLDFQSGRRARRSELSTVDSGIAIIGALVAGQYFDRDAPEEKEIRKLADAIYLRADWSWASDAFGALSHGWRPETGFIPYAWRGYNEALFLYLLGLGSPTHPLGDNAWDEWTSTYKWKRIYGSEHLYGGPLFMHQTSHAYIDFRGIRDDAMRQRGSDYFENSRLAVRLHREYGRRNPRKFAGFGENCWGLSASDGPGRIRRGENGDDRKFHGYRARGAPFGCDDGTLSPAAVAASIPFAPAEVDVTLRYCAATYPAAFGEYGCHSGLNPSLTCGRDMAYWVSGRHYAIDQGHVVLMIENHLTGLIWRLLRGSQYILSGLSRAGFTGGWLE